MSAPAIGRLVSGLTETRQHVPPIYKFRKLSWIDEKKKERRGRKNSRKSAHRISARIIPPIIPRLTQLAQTRRGETGITCTPKTEQHREENEQGDRTADLQPEGEGKDGADGDGEDEGVEAAEMVGY